MFHRTWSVTANTTKSCPVNAKSKAISVCSAIREPMAPFDIVPCDLSLVWLSYFAVFAATVLDLPACKHVTVKYFNIIVTHVLLHTLCLPQLPFPHHACIATRKLWHAQNTSVLLRICIIYTLNKEICPCDEKDSTIRA
ncbi:unnamed protein product [Ostreobium quekettii]|uniref:Uncharacterized protein n=1 Tax=Ostreobium quekettii TaxID=121088 RepID=A0A8S1IYS7_9CHLO|nr:unnamed protein product [Ostreobium quekettii]